MSCHRFVRKLSLTLYLLIMPLTAQSGLPIFDSHLHYGGEDVANFSTDQIIDIFDDNNIAYALVSSTPNDGTEKLYRKAPQRIIPFLGLYQTLEDKRDWMWDESVVPRVKEALKRGLYRGIGEMHIFAKDRKSPVLKDIVSIASSKGLMLQVHGDAEILDEIFQIAPNVTVLWAHLGTRPQADYLRQVLERHPHNLYIDTTVRDRQLLADNGQLSSEWRQLFIDYQDRFTVGVDTFSVNRWITFAEVTQQIRRWLSQLPETVAYKLAYGNAYRLFFPDAARVGAQSPE
jgi:hypothetical protein